jgi:hypothetical protein
MATLTQQLTGEEPAKLKRKTPAQKKAFDAYRRAEQAEDRYLGSVFVTPTGSKPYREKTQAAYEACKRLGMTVEHGL